MRKIMKCSIALVLNIGILWSAQAYDRVDYRKGDFIHVWPRHGVWQLGLLSGGQSGVNNCVISTVADPQTAVLYLMFIFDAGGFSKGKTLNFSDGGTMTLEFRDKNFSAANDENYNSPDAFSTTKVIMSIDDWQFFEQGVVRQIATLNGIKWAGTSFPLMVAWDTPNPGDARQTSTLDILNHMRAGKELVMQSWMMTQRIPLAGFGAVLDEFSKCTDMQ